MSSDLDTINKKISLIKTDNMISKNHELDADRHEFLKKIKEKAKYMAPPIIFPINTNNFKY